MGLFLTSKQKAQPKDLQLKFLEGIAEGIRWFIIKSVPGLGFRLQGLEFVGLTGGLGFRDVISKPHAHQRVMMFVGSIGGQDPARRV